MYSDNILKYTIYFPDFFFAMIGIFFSIQKEGMEKETGEDVTESEYQWAYFVRYMTNYNGVFNAVL